MRQPDHKAAAAQAPRRMDLLNVDFTAVAAMGATRAICGPKTARFHAAEPAFCAPTLDVAHAGVPPCLLRMAYRHVLLAQWPEAAGLPLLPKMLTFVRSFSRVQAAIGAMHLDLLASAKQIMLVPRPTWAAIVGCINAPLMRVAETLLIKEKSFNSIICAPFVRLHLVRSPCASREGVSRGVSVPTTPWV